MQKLIPLLLTLALTLLTACDIADLEIPSNTETALEINGTIFSNQETSENDITPYIDSHGKLAFYVRQTNCSYQTGVSIEESNDYTATATQIEDRLLVFFTRSRYTATKTLDAAIFTPNSNDAIYYQIPLKHETAVYNLFCNFTDQSNGFLFVFSGENEYSFDLYKTADGGESWQYTSNANGATAHWRDFPTAAKFASESVGLVSYRYTSIENVSDRTYLTDDGGKTWFKLPSLPYPANTEIGYVEITNFTYLNEEYTIKAIFYTANGNDTELQFVSSDLEKWTLKK